MYERLVELGIERTTAPLDDGKIQSLITYFCQHSSCLHRELAYIEKHRVVPLFEDEERDGYLMIFQKKVMRETLRENVSKVRKLLESDFDVPLLD